MSIRVSMEPLIEAQSGAEPQILDGRAIAAALRRQLVPIGARLTEELGRPPQIALVRVGEDAASGIYVRNKIKACAEIGIASIYEHLPADILAAALMERIDELNAREDVDGILVQTPLPQQIDALEALRHVAPESDVDGFHQQNLGGLLSGRANLEACTPRGIMRMLLAAQVELRGKRAVMIGRSMTVGRPMAQMLIRADATVTVCHRHSHDLAQIVGDAEVLVVATGVAELVKGSWVRPGAVVIDVGISRREDGSLVGDVEFDAARERAALISPVPGGVGPMTVATLMENTLRAAAWRAGYRFDQPLVI